MKKQLLALSMCLALTTTCATADVTKDAPQKTTPQINASKTIVTPPTKPANGQILKSNGKAPKIMNKEEARKNFEQRKAKERELLYNALSLSEEQKVKAEELDAKTRAEAGSYLRKIQIEAKKLRDLKSKKASFFAIYKQKMELNKAKADANEYFANARQSFEAILTKEQKSKFEIIDKAKKAEMDKFKKEYKHHGRKKMNHDGFKNPDKMGPPPLNMGPGAPQGPVPMGPPPTK